jgi:hypothetical protein
VQAHAIRPTPNDSINRAPNRQFITWSHLLPGTGPLSIEAQLPQQAHFAGLIQTQNTGRHHHIFNPADLTHTHCERKNERVGPNTQPQTIALETKEARRKTLPTHGQAAQDKQAAVELQLLDIKP